MSIPNHPTFAIIGAAKSGTSSLYEYLKQHPDVFMTTPKEPKFFQWYLEEEKCSTELDKKIYSDSVKSWNDYEDLFENSGGYSAIGEASVSYLYHSYCAEKVHDFFPEIRLVVILRRPDERAFSQYVQTKWLGYEPLSFKEALEQEQNRISDNWGASWHYARQGYYSDQISKYLEYFPRDQMKIWLYDDLQRDPGKLVREVFEFIGVEAAFVPELSESHNVKYFPRRRGLDRLIRSDSLLKRILKNSIPEPIKNRIKAANQTKLKMPSDERIELIESFLPEIDRLEVLLARDLSAWKVPP